MKSVIFLFFMVIFYYFCRKYIVMERSIYQSLLQWKSKLNRKPLILLGARQVGKTYILKQFGNNEFQNLVYLNCHEDPFAKNLFSDLIAERIVRDIEIRNQTEIVAGKTLLFIDEIQEASNGLSSLKYFCENMPELHVVVAGSLLGISLREGESFPVGKVEMMKMFPMSFLEFLNAAGRPKLAEIIKGKDWAAMTTFHDMLTDYLRQYYFTGGMPESVATYLETNDVNETREVQRNILEAYQKDISKHTKPQIQRIHQVWESIPAQLARENKKFVFSAIRKGARAADFEIALQWLADAGLIYMVERVKVPQQPLKFYLDASAFKVYWFDCGLLACMMNAMPKDILLGSQAFTGFKGAFAENFVLQQLKASCFDETIAYFSKDNSSMEVDFVLEHGGEVVPIEVKAEENVKSKSLHQFITVDYADKNYKGIRFSMLPFISQDWMENRPLYAVSTIVD